MRRFRAFAVVALLLLVPVFVVAQDQLTSEQLRRMYDDAVAQMRSAQDRRNELARENEKLRGRIQELEDKLATLQAQLTSITDSTFRARSESSTFSEFMQSNVDVRARWQAFLQKSLFTGPDPKQLLDPDWPLPPK